MYNRFFAYKLSFCALSLRRLYSNSICTYVLQMKYYKNHSLNDSTLKKNTRFRVFCPNYMLNDNINSNKYFCYCKICKSV